MTRSAYIWMVFLVVLAITLASIEGKQRAAAIRTDSVRVLTVVVEGGCAENNRMRDLYLDLAQDVHPESIHVLRRGIRYENCEASAQRVVEAYAGNNE